MNKVVLKFVAGGIGLVAVAVGVLFLSDYIRYRSSPEYRAEQYFKDLERRYREDPYGGSTPEETLQLFIDALKKGDVELASKYFVVDYQKKWLGDLKRMKGQDLLDNMIRDLERARRGEDISEDSARFIVVNENKEVITVVGVAESPSGKWKLLDFCRFSYGCMLCYLQSQFLHLPIQKKQLIPH